MWPAIMQKWSRAVRQAARLTERSEARLGEPSARGARIKGEDDAMRKSFDGCVGNLDEARRMLARGRGRLVAVRQALARSRGNLNEMHMIAARGRGRFTMLKTTVASSQGRGSILETTVAAGERSLLWVCASLGRRSGTRYADFGLNIPANPYEYGHQQCHERREQ